MLAALFALASSTICSAAKLEHTDLVQNKVYTGLIVDCTETPGVRKRVEYPKIEVLGDPNALDYVSLLYSGNVVYANGWNDTKALASAGNNPVVQKAIAANQIDSTPQINYAAAQLVKRSLTNDNYLQRNGAVVLVVGPKVMVAKEKKDAFADANVHGVSIWSHGWQF